MQHMCINCLDQDRVSLIYAERQVHYQGWFKPLSRRSNVDNILNNYEYRISGLCVGSYGVRYPRTPDALLTNQVMAVLLFRSQSVSGLLNPALSVTSTSVRKI